MFRLALLVVIFACAGCVPAHFTRFENPIVDEGGTRVDPTLIGRWVDAEDLEGGEVWEIAADGDIHIVAKPFEAGASPREAHQEIVTARLGNLSVVSLRGGSDDDSWYYFRYRLPEPGVLSFSSDNTKYWRDSVRNKMVAGTIERRENGEEDVTITASGAELRDFVLGYGSVIFTDAEGDVFRLRRLPDGS